MIRYKTRVENNKFYVKFELYPQDVKCSRANYTATHKGGTGSYRSGIWEGVELYKVYGRVNSSNPWVDFGKQDNPEIYTHENGDSIQLRAIYRIKTMGYHWQCTNGEYPFFYYGNINKTPSKYVHGYFTDSHAGTPTNSLHGTHAIVPVDWKHISTEWSDWAYKHGQNNSSTHWVFSNGKYEQRNANKVNATNSNGWISDSGFAQAYRKSCMFTFEKEFSVNITSSGIVKDASVPELTVHTAKGDSGLVTVKYVDKYNSNGRLWLRAYCNGRQVEILKYNDSPVLSNGNTKDFNIDFVKTFGEGYRGNDIQYEAWAKNSHDKESAGTGKKGGHRFNGRPTVPNGLFVKGHNKDIIYDAITFSWNPSRDAENDSLSYDLHLTATTNNGTKLREAIIAEKVTNTNYNYNISNDPDNCNYSLKVRAFDGLIYSDWSSPLTFKKGAKPTGAIILTSPERDESNLYSIRPRFTFKGYDGKSTFVVVFNSKEYDTKKNPEMFAIDNDKVLFCINNKDESIKIKAYMKNAYGTSDVSSEYSFKFVEIVSDLKEGEYIKAFSINKILGYVQDKSKAYNITINLDNVSAKETIIKAKCYNNMVDALKAINDKLNNTIKSIKFDTSLSAQHVNRNTLNDEALWNKLFIDIRNI